MKRLLFSTFFCACIMSTFGQNELGVKLDLGVSQLRSNFLIGTQQTPTQTYSHNVLPSFTVGGYYDYALTDKFQIGTGLSFSQIEGRISYESTFLNIVNGLPEEFRWQSSLHLSYLNVPFKTSYQIGNWEFNLGARFSFLLRGKSNSMSEWESNGVVEVFKSPDQDVLFDSFNLGGTAGVSYLINERFGINLSIYQGINNLVSSSTADFLKWHSSQLTIGVNYALFKN